MTERDLTRMLSTLTVTTRPGEWCMVTGDTLPAHVAVQATITEAEGTTSVISVADAREAGLEPGFVMAWLTLDVNSALDAVGLTAAVAAALSDDGLTCNVLAGFHHDHLLVGFADRGRALEALQRLAERNRSD